MRPNSDFRHLVRLLLFSTPASLPGDPHFDSSKPDSSKPDSPKLDSSTFDIRNTNFFKILTANPSLARFYPDFSQHRSAKPSSNIDLEAESGIFIDPDQAAKNHASHPDGAKISETSKGSNSMAVHPTARICSHIKVNGVRCGSPALREGVFCYFHQRMIRGVRTPPRSRTHPMAMLEDRESIQSSLMEVINALARNHIDCKRASLILRALHIAVRNANHVHFAWDQDKMVEEVPEYPSVPQPKAPDLALQQAAVLSAINRPKPRYPSDYGITVEQALAWGEPPEIIEPPRDLAEANAAVARYIQDWTKEDWLKPADVR
ncbi:MAG: hypothetical protein WA824_07815 [Candidatus Sulfotelmatobacter sp.]